MIQRFVDEISRWLPWSPTMRVVLLGVEYDTSDDDKREAFLQDFRSRVQLTYRKGLSTPLKLVNGQEITSDAGWGCMLRVTQMMLAQCFVDFVLGREWRFEESRDLAPGSAYLGLVSCFLDVPDAPLSLHSLVATGQRLLGKEPSAWFGPTSAARAAGHLFEAAARADPDTSHVPAFLQRLACVVFEDGAIYKNSVLEQFSGNCSAVIVLVCRRLGLESFNLAEYRAGVESCFELPQFQGLASGNSGNSAHFFVGTHDDCLLYLDPHRVQPALETTEHIVASGLQAGRPIPLRWTRLNPSVCLSFLVKSPEEFTALCERLCEAPRSDVFEVLEQQPSYADRVEEATEGDMVLLE